MVSTLYRLSLDTLEWTLLWPRPPSDEQPESGPASSSTAPQERYFHTAEAWGPDKLVIFGGESYAPAADTSSPTEDANEAVIVTLDDVCVWNTTTNEWSFPRPDARPGVTPPEARYAHLAVVCRTFDDDNDDEEDSALMLIIGGQNVKNAYLSSVGVLDLNKMQWIATAAWDKHIGSYRAIATTSEWNYVPSQKSWPSGQVPQPKTPSLSQHSDERRPSAASLRGTTGGSAAVEHLSHSTRPTNHAPAPVLVFSNFNFTAVRRDLDIFMPTPSDDFTSQRVSLNAAMEGPFMPPGLRFPCGCIIGRHLVIYGTHLSHASNSFSIWALDLGEQGLESLVVLANAPRQLQWQKIDPGSSLARGSWNRAVAWKNSIVLLGDRERDIAADYDHRQTNFSHVTFVDLEAFGIYQPPAMPLSPQAQALGLSMLDQPYLTDFEIVCSDGKRLACSRSILEQRWQWFSDKLDDFQERAKALAAAQQRKRSQDLIGTPDLLSDALASATIDDAQRDADDHPSPPQGTAASSADALRISPRTLNLPERSEVAQAFLQYVYSQSLSTALQTSIPVLTNLLAFAKTYQDDRLLALVVHALHEALAGSPVSAGAIYEAATLANCTALQIRALRAMMLRGPSSGARPVAGQDMSRKDTNRSFMSSFQDKPTGAGPRDASYVATRS